VLLPHMHLLKNMHGALKPHASRVLQCTCSRLVFPYHLLLNSFSGRIIFTEPEMGKVGRIASGTEFRGQGVASAIMQALHVSGPLGRVHGPWRDADISPFTHTCKAIPLILSRARARAFP